MKRKYVFISLFWIGIVSPLIILYCLFSFQKEEDLPSVAMLDAPPEMLASLVLSDNGDTIGRYFKINRTSTSYNAISPYVIDALISTEDERFHEHSGIDFRALARAIKGLGKSGGASTITQQLSKLIFTLQKRKEKKKASTGILSRINEKVKENIIATRLEKRYCKEEIITMYLNQFDFLHNAVGIENAARVYFNKSPLQLNKIEAATLVGMCKNPSLYNPYSFKRKDYKRKIAKKKGIAINEVVKTEVKALRKEDSLRMVNRRNQVLMQWLKNSKSKNPHIKNKLTQKEVDSLKRKPIIVHYQQVDHKKGIAPYFREAIRAEVSSLLKQKDEKGNYIYAKENGKPYNIYEDGLKIYTSLNLNLQKHAEYAVNHHLKKNLQPEFFKNNKKLDKKLFSRKVKKETQENVIKRSIRNSDRYKNLKLRNLSKKEIDLDFSIPCKMSVFSYNGDIDTVMTPYDSVLYYLRFLHAGLVSIEPQTGFIKAWVGGTNFFHFKYDHVKQGKRQVGSTIKPFFYCSAMHHGIIKPCNKLSGKKVCIDIFYPDKNEIIPGRDPWCPKGKPLKNATFARGLMTSNNPATAEIMKLWGGFVGPKDFAKFLSNLNINVPSHQIAPSMILGTMDVSMMDMVAAQSVFVNEGMYFKPKSILRIENRKGKVIYSVEADAKEVFDANAAYETLKMMKGVVTNGTGRSLRGSYFDWGGITQPTAGKTGTTQNNTDGWFMGLTPDLVTGVWVGAEDKNIFFTSMRWGQGARMALPIYGYYMQKVYKDKNINISQKDFPKPINYDPKKFDCSLENEQGIEGNDFEEINDYEDTWINE